MIFDEKKKQNTTDDYWNETQDFWNSPLPSDRNFDSESYWDDEVAEQKKTLAQKIKSLTYLRVSLLIFACALALFIAAIVISAISGGAGNLLIGLFGLLALLISIGGIVLAIYGKFILQAPSTHSWLFALLPNLILFIVLLILYISGAKS